MYVDAVDGKHFNLIAFYNDITVSFEGFTIFPPKTTSSPCSLWIMQCVQHRALSPFSVCSQMSHKLSKPITCN